LSDKDVDNLLKGLATDNDTARNHGETSIQTDLDDFGNSMNGYDVIFQTTIATNKEMSKKHKKKYFMGVVVTVTKLDRFELEMETSPEYAMQIIGKNKDLEDFLSSLSDSIYRVRVYIPELHGFLPMLSRKQVEEYKKYIDDPEDKEQDFDFTKDAQKTNKMFLYEKTLSRITPFYCVSQNPPEINKAAKVEIADDNTMFFGTFLNVVGGS
jgi:hypothetical protein